MAKKSSLIYIMENQEIKLLKTNIADQEAILIKLKEKLFEKLKI